METKLNQSDAKGAMQAILESVRDDDPGEQLAAIKTFVDTPELWDAGMPEFAQTVTTMSDWQKIQITESLGGLEEGDIAKFESVIMAL